ncbi:bifunctional SulP family inorganic anion transporter/carbonic anhydrase [Nocardia sp. CDC159]|uniref:Bifunctional SulP family inorganic anion transporter/carbonic anhydrase n=1 Tax=Nocardia pulmonis TaxID=2951408 RepID=A0A9X2EA20_9NOCA|nr:MULTISPECIES: bifunctional SulP family inorganic anion transporter/carbonic anhydrase [Nocardia]MCM6774298.1 bifunctional SulP family inorganic anion transporter/carbonic anhydrase [Nocardia pulmonis]MCM6787636.1 bifunctional SulP family inorganic anion transporter/carbonic anhydrase [Nocardia sp. CDC159]
MSTVADTPPPSTGQPGPSWSERLSSIARYDLPASIVVFLVALPLSLGIAIASDAPVEAGLIAAAVGGLVVGLLGGSVLQVSGPAAGLTVVVAEVIHQFGWKMSGFIFAAAGVVQIVFGLSRIARAALAIAPVVVHAMLAGIGVTIALQQVHVLLGGTSHSTAFENITQLPGQLLNLHGTAFFIGLVVIAIMLGWRYVPGRIRVLPGPLVAVLIGTLLSLVVPGDPERIQISGSLFDAIGLPELPRGDWGAVALAVLTIALIASVESLLSAVAIDKLHTGRRANFDRELTAQGAANVTSGLLGGLPVTGVIVRSSANVAAGAKSRASAFLHGVWVLVFSVALVGVVEQIPKAALAGLLIVVGIQLVKIAHIKLAHRTGDLAVYAVTMLGVVFLNLLEGVIIGLALAFILLLWRVVHVSITAGPVIGTDRWIVSIEGTCTFLALPRLSKAFAEVPARADVLVELTVDFLDHAAYEAIHDWASQHQKAGGAVEFVETGPARMEHALTGPPRRGRARRLIDEVLGRHHERTVDAGTADHSQAPPVPPPPDAPRDRQQPNSLFLTCADPRIAPNVITHSDPGDLFTVRNIGNLVPADGTDASVEAALALALKQPNVRNVVVCGHSDCSAIQALLDGGSGEPALDNWLSHAQLTLEHYRAGHPVAAAAAAAGFAEPAQLSMVNVAVQLETLRHHPLMRQALTERGVRLSGLYFDLATARVLAVTADDVTEITKRSAEPAAV